MRYKLLITKFDESIMTLLLNGNLSRAGLRKELDLHPQTITQAFCRVRKTINEKLGFPDVKSDLQIFMFLAAHKDVLFGARYDSKANPDSDLVLFMDYLPREVDTACIKFDLETKKWKLYWEVYKACL